VALRGGCVGVDDRWPVRGACRRCGGSWSWRSASGVIARPRQPLEARQRTAQTIKSQLWPPKPTDHLHSTSGLQKVRSSRLECRMRRWCSEGKASQARSAARLSSTQAVAWDGGAFSWQRRAGRDDVVRRLPRRLSLRCLEDRPVSTFTSAWACLGTLARGSGDVDSERWWCSPKSNARSPRRDPKDGSARGVDAPGQEHGLGFGLRVHLQVPAVQVALVDA